MDDRSLSSMSLVLAVLPIRQMSTMARYRAGWNVLRHKDQKWGTEMR